MHGTFDINIEDISKIEGHASLELKVKHNEVKDVKLKIFENRSHLELFLISYPLPSYRNCLRVI